MNELNVVQSKLQHDRDKYLTVRDEYLALRARAQALALTEADGLPAEIKEDKALVSVFTAPNISTLPVPMTTTGAALTLLMSAQKQRGSLSPQERP